MDFVIAGIVLGSLAVVAGELFRIVGPKRPPAERRSLRRGADPANTPRAWAGACQSIGLLAATAGALLLLVTLLLMLLGASDTVGWLAVGLIGGVGTVVVLAGTWSILNHYRTGGFDPILVAERPAPPVESVNHDGLFDDDLDVVPAGLSQSAWVEVHSQHIEPAEVVAQSPPPAATDVGAGPEPEAVRISEPVSPPVPEVVAPIESVPEPDALAEPMAVPEEVPVAVVPPDPAPRQPVAARPEAPYEQWPSAPPTGGSAAPRSKSEPAEIDVPVIRERPRPATQAPPPEFARPNFEFPLIDLDEELPAWNASPQQMPSPVSPPPSTGARPIERPVAQTIGDGDELEVPDPPQSGFKSSLFADIGTEATQNQEGRHFSSSLLNELTADMGAPKAMDDIVLDEFSLPAEPRSDKRDPSSQS